MIIDPVDFRIVQINRAACELFGASASRLEGRSVADLGVFQAPESAVSFLREIAAGAQGKAVMRLVGERAVRFSVSPVETADGVLLACQLEPFLERAETVANQRTRDSLHRLAAIIESSRTAVVTADLRGVIDSWNSNAEVLFGYTADEAIGRTLSFLTPVELAWEDEIMRRAVLRGEELEGFETYRLRKDGQRIAVTLTVSSIAGHEEGGIAFLAQDISRRRRVEDDNRKLFRELSDLRLAIDASTIVAVTDTKGVITFVNDKLCEISGYSREELIGKTHRVVNSGYHPKSFFKNMWDTISAGRIWKGEIRNRSRDGRFYWVDSTIVPLLDEQGKPFQYISLRHDISVRKAAERERDESRDRMKLATEATGVGLWDWNVRTNRITWDDQMFRLYGVEPTADGQVDYEVWRTAVHEDDVALQEEMLQTVVARRTNGRREFRIRRGADREIRHIKAVETVRLGDDGEVEWVVGTNIDITERKRAVNSLLRSEAKFRSLVEATSQVIWSTDPQGNLLTNIDWRRLTGLDFGDREVFWETIVHPDDHARVEASWRESLANASKFEAEYRLQHSDGTYHHFVSRAVPVFENHEVREWIGAITDITAERRAVDRLRESEERFRQLTEGMPQLVWTCNADDGRCDYLSPQWVRYTGIPEAEQLGYAWLERLHPDDRESAFAAWNEAVANAGELITEFRIRRHDGVYRWFHTRAIPLRDSTGKIVKWFGTNTDIDGRKRAEDALATAERRFRATFEQAAVGIAHVALDGGWRLVNQRLCDITGYSHDELLATSFHEITHPDDLGVDLELHAKLIAGEIEKYSIEIRYIRKDGVVVWANLTVSGVADESGNVLHLISVVEDITERKRREENAALLSALNEELISADGICGVISFLGRRCESMFGATTCATIEIDGGANEAVVFEEWRRSESPSLLGRYRLTDYLARNILDNLVAGRTIVLDDVHASDEVEEPARFEGLGIRSFVNVPLHRDGELVFVFGVYLDAAHAWRQDEIEVIEEAARRLWNHLERRRVEHELRAEQSRIDKIAASSPSMLCSFRVTPDGRFNYPFVSRAVADVCGFSAEELMNDGELIGARINAVDADRLRESIAGSRSTMSLWNEAYRYAHPLKGEVWLESFATPVVEDDGGVIWHGIVSDITARKVAEHEISESEKRYRLLFETNPLPMWVYDLETLAFLAVNDAAIMHYGYSRREFMSMTIKDIRPTEDLMKLYTAVKSAKSSYKKAGRFRHRLKDGTTIDVEIVSHGITFDGRRARLVLANDITDKLANERLILSMNETLEQKVNERTAELNAVNRELEAFSYSVSHDLRAPLRAMDGFSLALIEDYNDLLDENGRNFLNRIRLASQKMAQLIDDLLKLSRVSRGEIHRAEIDLTKMVETVAEQLQEFQPKASFELKIGKGVRAFADERLMRVAFENLLGNAWKFTSKNEHAVISFGRRKVDGRRVFFISDNGAGFDMAYADKLFGAFQRLHSTKEFEGTGIGLATVQRIINRHGGRIWAESKPGKGTTFYFTVDK